MLQQPFFSLDLRQPINQWLCIALISLMGFCVILYYLVNKASAFGNYYVSATLGEQVVSKR